MVGNLCIFLSSTCHDLFQERYDLAIALSEMGHNAVISELSGTLPVNPNMTTFDTCLKVIEKMADVVVVVIKNRYGSTDNQGVSITQIEYQRARSLRRPVFVFVHNTTCVLYKAWLNNNRTGSFPPVEDNRVFNFVDAAYKSCRWVFVYSNVEDIIKTLKYQLSAMFKDLLAKPKRDTIDPVAKAARMLRSQHPKARQDAVRVLVDYKAVEELIDGMCHNSRPDVRESAAAGATELKIPEAIPYLIGGLRGTGRRGNNPIIPRADEFLAKYGEQAVTALLAVSTESFKDFKKSELHRWKTALSKSVDEKPILDVLKEAKCKNRWELLEAALLSGLPLQKKDVEPVLQAYLRSPGVWWEEIVNWLSDSGISSEKWVKNLIATLVEKECKSVLPDGDYFYGAKELAKDALRMGAITSQTLGEIAKSIPNKRLARELCKIAGLSANSI